MSGKIVYYGTQEQNHLQPLTIHRNGSSRFYYLLLILFYYFINHYSDVHNTTTSNPPYILPFLGVFDGKESFADI